VAHSDDPPVRKSKGRKGKGKGKGKAADPSGEAAATVVDEQVEAEATELNPPANKPKPRPRPRKRVSSATPIPPPPASPAPSNADADVDVLNKEHAIPSSHPGSDAIPAPSLPDTTGSNPSTSDDEQPLSITVDRRTRSFRGPQSRQRDERIAQRRRARLADDMDTASHASSAGPRRAASEHHSSPARQTHTADEQPASSMGSGVEKDPAAATGNVNQASLPVAPPPIQHSPVAEATSLPADADKSDLDHHSAKSHLETGAHNAKETSPAATMAQSIRSAAISDAQRTEEADSATPTVTPLYAAAPVGDRAVDADMHNSPIAEQPIDDFEDQDGNATDIEEPTSAGHIAGSSSLTALPSSRDASPDAMNRVEQEMDRLSVGRFFMLLFVLKTSSFNL
jgi:hypothetical protein